MTEPHQGRIAMWFIILLVAVSAFMMAAQFAQPSSASWLAAMTPIYAGGMLVGARRSLSAGIAMIVAAQLVGSIGIAAILGRMEFAFYGWSQVANIACLCVAPLIGARLLREDRNNLLRVRGAAVTAIAFFLLSNFAAWAFASAAALTYPKTLSGLITCYYMGLPYFGRTLVACVGWSVVLFSSRVLAIATEPVKEVSTEATTAAS